MAIDWARRGEEMILVRGCLKIGKKRRGLN
jgi:hypothetical protein